MCSSDLKFNRRRATHLRQLKAGSHTNRHLQAAWNQYGEKAFVFVVVEEVPDDANILEMENKWLAEHVGKEYCYNIGIDATAPMLGVGGEASPTWGYKHTPEALAVIAAASTGRNQDAETIRRKTAHLIGKPKSAEVRAKISATLTGEGNYWYGKKRPDHGAKVSRAIQAISPEGQVLEYASITALREKSGMKPPTINRAVKSGKPLTRGPYKGWAFKYVAP